MKTSRFAILLALVTIVACSVAIAQKMIRAGGPAPVFGGSDLKIEGKAKLGGVNTISAEIEVLRDVENVKIHFTIKGGVRIINGEKYIYYKKLIKGQIIRASITAKFEGVPASVQVSAWGKEASPGGSTLQYDKIDEDGTLLSLPAYMARNNEINFKKIEYRYDPEEPLPLNEQNIQQGMISDEKAKATRDLIDNLKKTKGSISDSEAIELLHNRIELFIRSGIEGQKALDILWDARESTKTKGGDYWKNVEEILKIQKIKFFRPNGLNNSYNIDNSFTDLEKVSAPKATVTLTGQFMYKKHCYDKNSGLLTTTIDKPIRRAKIWVWGYWTGQTLTRFGPTMTDDNGNFTVNVDNVVYPARFCPFVYCKGPDYAGAKFERVKVVTDTIKFNYSDGPDSLTWRFRWWKWDTVSSSSYAFSRSPSYAGEQAFDGGLYPAANQPRSGAVNIFDMFLNAYDTLVTNEHTNDSTLYRIAAKWQPGYSLTDHGFGGTCTDMYPSGYVDTTWVNADTTGGDKTTDEWDDLVLLHEFAHHAMAKCAEYPPNSTGLHYWYGSYPEQLNMSYSEGWANFFNHLVSDSLFYIDTKEMIGKTDTTVGWWNIENPWSHYDSLNNPLQAGPYCEASVAGSLWDIYDSQSENPYSSDSYCDTLTMGFNEIWNIVDNYITNDHNCWSIWNFMKGWDYYKYDHTVAYEKNILRHHKILRPGAVYGVTASIVPPAYWTTVLTWTGSEAKSSGSKDDTLTIGYNIYRKDEGATSFTQINDTTVTGLSYNDCDLADNKNYSYKVVAIDSAFVEGAPSDSVDIYVEHPPFISTTNMATAYNNTEKLVYGHSDSTLHLVFLSNSEVWHTKSTDGGNTWTQDTAIGGNSIPCLALNDSCNPSVIQKSSSGPSLYDYTWWATSWQTINSNPVIPVSKASGGGGTTLPVITWSRPSMDINTSDTAHVGFIEYGVASNEEISEGGIKLMRFPIDDYASAQIEGIGYYGKTPMIAVDDSNDLHWAYVYDNDIYYVARINDTLGTPVNLSQTSEVSKHPMIDIYGDRLSVTWEEESEGGYDVYNRILTLTTGNWTDAENISHNSSNSVNPVTAMAGYAYWADDSSGTYQIYRKRYIDGSGWPDSTKLRITNNDSLCDYPQISFMQTLDTTRIFGVWTQGDAQPYQVKFHKSTVQPVSKRYIPGGSAKGYSANTKRDGSKVFGPASYQRIDYGKDEVSYQLGGLDASKDYKIAVTYYFEDKYKAAKNSGNDSLPVWIEMLEVDTHSLAISKVISGKATTVEVVIPQGLYCDDGGVTLSVKKMLGDYAMATDIKLYEFYRPRKTQSNTNATVTEPSVQAKLPLTNQLCQNAPNPFSNQPTTIEYAVTKPGEVCLNVYNISGQLVKSLVKEYRQPGYYSVKWNGKDDGGRQVVSGVYFYRINSGSFAATKKLVVLK